MNVLNLQLIFNIILLCMHLDMIRFIYWCTITFFGGWWFIVDELESMNLFHHVRFLHPTTSPTKVKNSISFKGVLDSFITCSIPLSMSFLIPGIKSSFLIWSAFFFSATFHALAASTMFFCLLVCLLILFCPDESNIRT